MSRHANGDWAGAAVSAVANGIFGVVVGDAMAVAPLGLFLLGLLPLALWCIVRAAMWQESMSRAGTMAGLFCVLLPMTQAFQHEKYVDLPLPLTFSAQELPLQQALTELRDAGFDIERDAWRRSSTTVLLSSRRPTFEQLDLALRVAGVRVHIDYNFAEWSLTLGARARGTWGIRVLDGVRFGPIRWVQRDLLCSGAAQETA